VLAGRYFDFANFAYGAAALAAEVNAVQPEYRGSSVVLGDGLADGVILIDFHFSLFEWLFSLVVNALLAPARRQKATLFGASGGRRFSC
jgi:hypothetical protein